MRHLVFATDSRGSKLKSYLEKEEPFDFHSDNIVIVRPGGKLSDIRELVKTKVDSIMRIDKLFTIWIFLAGGICNLTSKITHSGGTEIQYIRSDQNVQSVILQFRDFFNYFQSIENVFVKIACIPCACIEKYLQFNISKGKLFYSIFTPEERQMQQKYLEEDVKEINTSLFQFTFPVRWDRDILICKRKKSGRNKNMSKKIVKLSFKHLYDGVHPDSELSDKWFHFMCLSLSSSVNSNANVLIEDNDSDQESGSWDFKRSK